jgi:F-type H+-transporting ATPase subunit a
MTPFNQFEIIVIIKNILKEIDISITNAVIFMIIGVIGIIYIYKLSMSRIYVLENMYQTVIMKIFEYIEEMVEEQAGVKANKYFALIFTVFVYLLILNVLGLIPFSFAVTGQIAVTSILSFGFFIGLIIIGIKTLKKEFVNVFIPKGVYKELLPLLVCIEVLSFLIRPISLAVRLFANILAGHILLYIISSSVLVISSIFLVFGLATSVILCAFFILEIGISFLQAYVFSILMCIYLRDGLYKH